MNKICAGIVSYNPDTDIFLNNIKVLEKQVELIVIVDNGSKNQLELEKVLKLQNFNILFLKNKINEGVASALNTLCKNAIKLGFDSIFTIDQDTLCPIDIVTTFMSDWNKKIGIMGPNVYYLNNDCAFSKGSGVINAEWLITSGSLVNLEAFTKVGGFDEKLFIDDVDRDFGIRVKKSGFLVVKNLNVVIKHSLGDLKCKKILGRLIYITNHRPERYYYMARNSIYLDWKLNIKNSKRFIRKLRFKVMFFEKNKKEKMKWIKKGIDDAKKMIKGQCVEGPLEQ